MRNTKIITTAKGYTVAANKAKQECRQKIVDRVKFMSAYTVNLLYHSNTLMHRLNFTHHNCTSKKLKLDTAHLNNLKNCIQVLDCHTVKDKSLSFWPNRNERYFLIDYNLR